jgi:hypothetical protein
VCSGFHKGRLKVVYDPYGVPQTGGGYDPAEYNTAYTEIVDIAECNDFCIDVGWGQSTPFRRHLDHPQILGNVFASASGTSPASPVGLNSANLNGVGNGTLAVYVVNELTTPNSTVTNDIKVLVSISACDDFEVAAPTEYYLSRLAIAPEINPQRIVPQGGDEMMLSQDTPVVDPYTIRFMGSHTVLDPLVNRIHMGEAVASFRQLLKRYQFHEAMVYPADSTAAVICQLIRRMFPFWPGYTTAATTASDLITTGNTFTGNYVYANFTLMHYLTRAYGAWRGSIRYTIDTTYNEQLTSLGDVSTNHMTTWSVGRIGAVAPRALASTMDDDIPAQNLGTASTEEQRFIALAIHRETLDGSTRFNTVVNPIQSFEVPYYSRYRFAPAKQGQLWTTKDEYQDSYKLSVTTVGSNGGGQFAYKYVAAGEDFALMFYLSPPIFYTQLPPTPP